MNVVKSKKEKKRKFGKSKGKPDMTKFNALDAMSMDI